MKRKEAGCSSKPSGLCGRRGGGAGGCALPLALLFRHPIPASHPLLPRPSPPARRPSRLPAHPRPSARHSQRSGAGPAQAVGAGRGEGQARVAGRESSKRTCAGRGWGLGAGAAGVWCALLAPPLLATRTALAPVAWPSPQNKEERAAERAAAHLRHLARRLLHVGGCARHSFLHFLRRLAAGRGTKGRRDCVLHHTQAGIACRQSLHTQHQPPVWFASQNATPTLHCPAPSSLLLPFINLPSPPDCVLGRIQRALGLVCQGLILH